MVVVLLLVLISTVYSATYKYALDIAVSGSYATNGSGWQVSRFLIQSAGTNKSVCNSDIDNDTISTLCALSGYTTYTQLTSNISSLTWTDNQLNTGYTIECGSRDTFDDCTITSTDSCTEHLVVNCSDHYDTIIGNLSTNELIIPIILIPALILYIIILCYLDYNDVKKTAAKRQQYLATQTIDAFKAGVDEPAV